jgi:hypothetical protein
MRRAAHRGLGGTPRHRTVSLALLVAAAWLILVSGSPVTPPAATSAAAAPAEGTLEVLQVGWDGTIVPSTWSPVRVRVTGGTADGTARVEVVLKNRIYPPGIPGAPAMPGMPGAPGRPGSAVPQPTPFEDPTVAYGQEVALPAGVAKELTLWVPAEMNMSGTVRLVSGNQALAEETVEFRSNNSRTPLWPLVGVLAESPAVARGVGQVELPFQGLPVPLSVARLTVADLPSLAERLNALSAVIVQGNAAATLTNEQRQAIHEWVVTGGHLILAGGPDAARAAAILPPGTLPLGFAGADLAADLGPLRRWAETGAPAPGAGPVGRLHVQGGAILAGTPDVPLVWRLSLGEGSVTQLAADPTLEPLASWTGTADLWRKTLEPALPDAENWRYAGLRPQDRYNPSRLQAAVDALPPEAFPSWQVVALILGAFALLAGPALHLLLWRLGHREWIWVAVPAVAVLVAGAMYVFGIRWSGRDVLVNVVSHVRLDPGAGTARQAVAAGFFAPTRSRLAITVPGEVPVRASSPREFNYTPYGSAPLSGTLPAAAEPPIRVAAGRNTQVDFNAGQWAMRTVLLSRTLGRETGQITGHLTLDGGLLRGTVRNDTPYFLEDATVIVGQNVARIGSLAPGQAAHVLLDPTQQYSALRGGQPLSWRLYGQPVDGGRAGIRSAGSSPALPPAPPIQPAARPVGTPTPAPTPAPATTAAVATPVATVAASASLAVSSLSSYPPGSMERLEIPRDPEVQRRVRLLDSAASINRAGPGLAQMPLTFLAFTRQAVGTELPSAGQHPTYHLTLIEQPLRLDLPPGPFLIPGGITPPEVVSQQSAGIGSGGSSQLMWWELRGGSITLAYRPPLPAMAQVQAVTVTTRQVGQSMAAPQAPFGGRMPMPPALPAPAPGQAPGVSPAEAGVFAIYNWRSAAWEGLPAGHEEARVDPAGPYVGPGGEIQVRVSADPDRLVRFLIPEVTLEGTAGG